MSYKKTKTSISDIPLALVPPMVEKERAALMLQGRLNAVHWFVISLALAVTFGAWYYSKNLIAARTEVRFNVAAGHIPDLIRERLQKYELALLAGVSAVKVNGGDIDWAGWRTFAKNLDVEDRYPGINGIGVIHQIAASEMAEYLAEQRLDRPDFSVHPPHGRNIYQPITYVYPVEINAEAVGLDMVHEANRHNSLNMARDTGLPQITAPIVLVQDAARTPGFLFFAPLYSDDLAENQADRRASFTGAVYAPFIVSKLIEGTLGPDKRSVAIRIMDGGDIIYDEITNQGRDYDPETLGEKQVKMDLHGREWTLDIRAGLDFRAENSPRASTYILVAGLTIDLALLALFVLLTLANRRGLRFADLATSALVRDAEALSRTNAELVLARKQAESVGKMKSNFLATMSHEVRTPLNAISGVLMLLDRAKLSSEQDGLVQAGKAASEKLLKLLTDVLDISKLEANAVHLWEREVALGPIMDEWRVLAEAMVEKLGKNIVVTTVVAPDFPKSIMVDDIRLTQVMNNLMDNAARFTEVGHITISATTADSDGNRPASYVLSIEDTGMGISDEDLPIVFDRFRQVDGSITRTAGGSGLGLAICQDLVKLLGGEVKVSSELGVGTTFTVTLPVRGVGSTDK